MRIQFLSRLPFASLLCAAVFLAPATSLWAQAEATATTEVPASELVDDPSIAEMIEIARKSDGARNHIEVLTSHFPHRMTGSPQLNLAQDWLVVSFEDWGLIARKEQWGDMPVGFERHRSSGKVVAPEELDLDFLTPAWSPGTLGPVRGKLLLAPVSLEELRERAAEYKGAWVLRNASAPRAERRERHELLEEIGVAGLLQTGLARRPHADGGELAN